ncbi:MAG: hypothetical protein L0H26_01880 [Microlunatus sp.]|nr:hypothetical protein [Microlunatus sp.]
MPRLRTDDGPRKLRAVWLGPAGHTLPFQWTYVQWAVTLIAVPVAGTIGTVVVWLLLHDPVWALGIGGLWCGAAGMWLAVRLMRNVTYDEPLRYQRRLIRQEFSPRFSRPVGARRIAVRFELPPIGYLSPAVRSSMGWDVGAQRPLATSAMSAAAVRAGPPKQTNPYLSNPYLSNPSAPSSLPRSPLDNRHTSSDATSLEDPVTIPPHPTNPYLTPPVPVLPRS